MFTEIVAICNDKMVDRCPYLSKLEILYPHPRQGDAAELVHVGAADAPFADLRRGQVANITAMRWLVSQGKLIKKN
jgi:hypothetical protein